MIGNLTNCARCSLLLFALGCPTCRFLDPWHCDELFFFSSASASYHPPPIHHPTDFNGCGEQDSNLAVTQPRTSDKETLSFFCGQICVDISVSKLGSGDISVTSGFKISPFARLNFLFAQLYCVLAPLLLPQVLGAFLSFRYQHEKTFSSNLNLF